MQPGRGTKRYGINSIHTTLLFPIIIRILICGGCNGIKHNLTFGIIYDDTFDYQRWDLLNLLTTHTESLEHIICSDVSYAMCEAAANLHFIAGKYNTHEVCRQIGLGARIIISITTCNVAHLIEAQCRKYDIPHLAVPKPICTPSEIHGSFNGPVQWNIEELPWFAIRSKVLTRGLHFLSKVDQAYYAILLSDGPGEMPLLYSIEETRNLVSGTGNVKCSTNLFNLNPMKSRYRLRPSSTSTNLKDLLMVDYESAIPPWYMYSANHVYVFSKLYDPVSQVREIMNSNITQNEVFWVFVESTDMVPHEMIELLQIAPNAKQSAKPNIAFLRQLPMDYVRYLSTDQYFPEDIATRTVNVMTKWPERILLMSQLIFLSGKAFAFINLTNGTIINDQEISCTANSPEVYNIGSTLRSKIFKYVQRTLANEQLLFYATHTITATGRTRLVLTAKINEYGANLTAQGEVVLKETKVSGLFPNRFRGLDNRVLRIGTVIDIPLIATGNKTSDGVIHNATGIVVDILDTLAERFNFRYVLLESSDGQYGEKRPNGSWTGLIGDLISRRIDIAATMLSLTQDRDQVINLLGPFLLTSSGMMMAKMTVDQYPFKMLKPFRSVVWYCIFCSVIIAGVAMFVLNRCSPFSAWNLSLPGASSDEVSLGENMWSVVGNYVLQGSEFYPIAVSARTAQLLIWLFVLIIMSTWQADMTAFMTRSYVKPTINSLRDLANQKKIKPVMLSGSSIVDVFKNKDDAIYQKIYTLLTESSVEVQSTQEGYDLVRQDPNYVFIHDSTLLRYLAQQDCESVQMIPEVFDEQIAGFAVLPGQAFEEPFSRFLSQAFESGVIRRIFDKWLFSVKLCKFNEADYRPMKVQDVLGAFIILCSCALLSITVLVGENAWRYWVGSYWKKVWSRMKQWFILHMIRIKSGSSSSDQHDEHSKRRSSDISVDELPESVARQFRYAGRRRSTCAYNASLANLKNSSKSAALYDYFNGVRNRINAINKSDRDQPSE